MDDVHRYIGVDDAKEAISSAKSKHGDTPNFSFHQKDYVHVDLPKADLLVSRAALLVRAWHPCQSSVMS